MYLSLTPLEDAWKSNSNNNSNNQTIHSNATHDIHAINSTNTYDDMIINVASYQPSRIDLVITDMDLIQHMKQMTYVDQQRLATRLLKEYFANNPSSAQTIATIPQLPKLPSNSTKIHIPSDFKPSTASIEDESEVESLTNTTPAVEYFEHNSKPIGGPTPNRSMLYTLLFIFCFLLYERVKLFF